VTEHENKKKVGQSSGPAASLAAVGKVGFRCEKAGFAWNLGQRHAQFNQKGIDIGGGLGGTTQLRIPRRVREQTVGTVLLQRRF